MVLKKGNECKYVHIDNTYDVICTQQIFHSLVASWLVLGYLCWPENYRMPWEVQKLNGWPKLYQGHPILGSGTGD